MESARDTHDPVTERLLALGAPAFRLASRFTESRESAEDVVQQAYLEALGRVRAGVRPERDRVWFLRVVANVAKKRLRSEAGRRRREAAMMPERPEEPGDRGELVAALRVSLETLDTKYRVPLGLCYEEGLTQREAAEVLEMPESTISKYVNMGLDRLRRALARAGYAAVPAAVLAGLKTTAPAVPATLAAGLEKLVAGQAAQAAGSGAGPLAGSASVLAKGGIAMKVVAGILAAGAVAGAVAVSTGAFQRDGGGPLASPGGAGEPAPVNPYNGMQEREEVYEFTQKPSVRKEGGKWVISFASKGACDATVAIVDKDGNVIRHLASGVLGKNAPHPFQQNSLSQKLAWDGLTDDFKKAPAGCRVKVSLGLKPEYERNVFPAPYHFLRSKPAKGGFIKVAADGKGNTYVAALDGRLVFGHVYDKTGKYVRTFWPPPAKDVDKVGVKLTTTIWGDKTPWAGWSGPFHVDPKHGGGTLEAILAASGLAPAQFKDAPWPASLPKPSKKYDALKGGLDSMHWVWFQKWSRVVVDPRAKVLYGTFEGMALSEETGDVLKGAPVPLAVGPDWCLGFGSWGTPGYRVFMRWPAGTVPKKKGHTPEGLIPWPEGSKTWDAERKFLWTGQSNYGNGCNFCGFDITERGDIVQKILGTYIEEMEIPQAVLDDKKALAGGKDKDLKALGATVSPGYSHVIQVTDRNGRCLTRSAVENLANMASISMDRDGNLYVSQGAILPPGQKELHGVANCPGKPRAWGGSIVKFRGQGGKYPLGKVWWSKGKDVKTNPKEAAPADALQVADGVRASGALWSYGGLSNMVGSGACECGQATYNQDGWGRLWVPNNAVSGVMVVDPNGNFVMRVGKYGNVDDEGIRFAWIRSVYATDEALYVHDMDNARLLKIALKYAAEETVGLDGALVSSGAPAPAPTTAESGSAPATPEADPQPPLAARGEATPAEACRGWLSLARSYARAGRKDKAREYLQKIIAQHPGTDYAARARRELAGL